MSSGECAPPGIDDPERETAEAEIGVAVDPDVRRNDARRLVDPRIELDATLREPALRDIGGEVDLGLALRPDLGAGCLQRLQAIDVVGVVVRDDHAADRRARHRADRGDHRAAERRRAERVEHDDAVARHDEARVRHEALVRGAGDAGRALEEPHVLGDPLRREARCRRRRGMPAP